MCLNRNLLLPLEKQSRQAGIGTAAQHLDRIGEPGNEGMISVDRSTSLLSTLTMPESS